MALLGIAVPGEAGRGQARLGGARHGLDFTVRLGMVSQGVAWLGLDFTAR